MKFLLLYYCLLLFLLFTWSRGLHLSSKRDSPYHNGNKKDGVTRRAIIPKHNKPSIFNSTAREIRKADHVRMPDLESNDQVVKGTEESSSKSSILGTNNEQSQGMSAIVVIGNKTHRISGPIISMLMADINKKEQEDKENTKKLVSQKTLPIEPQPKVNLKQQHQKPSVKWASNQTIDTFLSKSLSDAKALKLIKTLLAQQKSSSNLKKEQSSDQQFIVTGGMNKLKQQAQTKHHAPQKQQQLSFAVKPTSSMLLPTNPGPSRFKEGTLGPLIGSPTYCRNIRSKQRCQHLRDVGLCLPHNRHRSNIQSLSRKRCQQTCLMCDPYLPCSDCNGLCVGCTIEIDQPSAPQQTPIPPTPSTQQQFQLPTPPPPPPPSAVSTLTPTTRPSGGFKIESQLCCCCEPPTQTQTPAAAVVAAQPPCYCQTPGGTCQTCQSNQHCTQCHQQNHHQPCQPCRTGHNQPHGCCHMHDNPTEDDEEVHLHTTVDPTHHPSLTTRFPTRSHLRTAPSQPPLRTTFAPRPTTVPTKHHLTTIRPTLRPSQPNNQDSMLQLLKSRLRLDDPEPNESLTVNRDLEEPEDTEKEMTEKLKQELISRLNPTSLNDNTTPSPPSNPILEDVDPIGNPGLLQPTATTLAAQFGHQADHKLHLANPDGVLKQIFSQVVPMEGQETAVNQQIQNRLTQLLQEGNHNLTPEKIKEIVRLGGAGSSQNMNFELLQKLSGGQALTDEMQQKLNLQTSSVVGSGQSLTDEIRQHLGVAVGQPLTEEHLKVFETLDGGRELLVKIREKLGLEVNQPINEQHLLKLESVEGGHILVEKIRQKFGFATGYATGRISTERVGSLTGESIFGGAVPKLGTGTIADEMQQKLGIGVGQTLIKEIRQHLGVAAGQPLTEEHLKVFETFDGGRELLVEIREKLGLEADQPINEHHLLKLESVEGGLLLVEKIRQKFGFATGYATGRISSHEGSVAGQSILGGAQKPGAETTITDEMRQKLGLGVGQTLTAEQLQKLGISHTGLLAGQLSTGEHLNAGGGQSTLAGQTHASKQALADEVRQKLGLSSTQPLTEGHLQNLGMGDDKVTEEFKLKLGLTSGQSLTGSHLQNLGVGSDQSLTEEIRLKLGLEASPTTDSQLGQNLMDYSLHNTGSNAVNSNGFLQKISSDPTLTMNIKKKLLTELLTNPSSLSPEQKQQMLLQLTNGHPNAQGLSANQENSVPCHPQPCNQPLNANLQDIISQIKTQPTPCQPNAGSLETLTPTGAPCKPTGSPLAEMSQNKLPEEPRLPTMPAIPNRGEEDSPIISNNLIDKCKQQQTTIGAVGRPNPVHPVSPLLDPDSPCRLPGSLTGGMDLIQLMELKARAAESGEAIIDGHCFIAIDLGIAIDTSRAAYENWSHILPFLQSLIKQFEVVGKSRIGIITYSNEARIEIPFGGILGRSGLFKTETTYKERLSQIQPNPNGFQRRTDLALNKAIELFYNGRRQVPKALIVLEHGGIIGHDHTVDWRALQQEPADRLRSIGVNIFTVGFTKHADPEELQSLAGSESHVISLEGYQQLTSAVSPLVEKACTLASVVKRSNSPKDPRLYNRVKSKKDCIVKFTKLGCYNDDQNNPRPLPKEILNDISFQFPGFSGKQADWGEWDDYYKDFVCRCAKETIKHGYKVFGVQNFASCFSGPKGKNTYFEDGKAEDHKCVANSFKKCDVTDSICVGKKGTNFVYTINDMTKRNKIEGEHRMD
ncbi:uncharacterized protein [Clytia hemisphaerica]|uniref:VWFA domain-containing protein n=1 Tax=Clytia hemisphaerica TaxID=252671 RepID=A0A7M5V1A4_9CNID